MLIITKNMTDLKGILIVIRGPLGVGKTTVAQILAQKIRAKYISLDKIIDDNHLVEPGTDGIPLESFMKANEIIHEIVSKSRNSFIIDGCFYYQEQIDDLKKKFSDNIEIITLTSNVEKSIERDSKRKNTYGEDSARFVHMITTKIKAGYKIDNTNLSVNETVKVIMARILKV